MMVTLLNGNILRFVCKFTHQGEGQVGVRVYAAIGKKAVVGGFDEKQFSFVDVDIPSDYTPTEYTINVDIVIENVGTVGYPAGADYEAYVKLQNIPGADIFWYGPENDIELLSGIAEFSNLVVTYSPV